MSYRILLFVHVTAVIVWVGANVVFQIVSERAAVRNDDDKVGTLVGLARTFGPAFFGTLTAVVLLSGVSLVLDGGWGFDHVFIIGGLTGVVASGALGGALLGPTSHRLQESMKGGVVTDETRALVARLRNLGRLDLLIMITVVFLMTVKPGD